MATAPPERVQVWTHDVFREHDTGPHPERIERIEVATLALESSLPLQERIDWRRPSPIDDESLLRCHTRAHLQHVDATTGSSGHLDPDTVYSPCTAEAARLAAGAAIGAVTACWRGECSSAFSLARPPGHHATPNRAMGFCFFNSAAVAARHLQSLGCSRVLIIDWDVHHGNGTQDIFYEDPTVFYYSLHQHPLYPGTGRAEESGRGAGVGTTRNRPLPAGFPADRYRALFDADLDEIVAGFAPDFALVSAGFDSHRDDPLGSLLLDEGDFAELTNSVCRRFPRGRVASVLEGGYNLDALAASVESHVRALTEAARD